MTLREAARSIFDSALAAAAVRPLVLTALAGTGPPEQGRLIVVGAGKASGAMAAAVEEAWGERVADGLVVVKDGYGAPTRRVRMLEAGHPVPDERGAAAAREILALTRSAGAGDLVLVLVSGGGSALIPAPAPPVTLGDKQAVTRLLLAAGANINQLNAVRKHCSLLKGGQLARAAAPARVHALLLSDVIGDPLDVIASGPTAPDVSTFGEALAVLDHFGLRNRAPRPVIERLEQGVRGQIPETPKPDDPLFARVTNVVIGNKMGTDPAGNSAFANGNRGLLLYSDGTATGNKVGVDLGGNIVANVISGNAFQGIRVNGFGTSGSVIEGNLIGTVANGSAALSNGTGILCDGGANANQIGGAAIGAGNVISGNNNCGIDLGGSGTSTNTILHNIIGLDLLGSPAIPNGHGIAVGILTSGPSNNNIGPANVISGNSSKGIWFKGSSTSNNTVTGNLIGTNDSGSATVGNIGDGILIESGAPTNRIENGNIISGNGEAGVHKGLKPKHGSAEQNWHEPGRNFTIAQWRRCTHRGRYSQ